MYALWGMGLMMLAKLIIVADSNVDVQNLSEVGWRVFNNIDPKRDVVIVEGPLDALDHASPLPYFGGKMGIDATRKGPGEGHMREWPPDIQMAPTIKKLVGERWAEYGF
jgi:4-hydroxy-3-polyprenylbenzoate decarboxylase